jgi:hypothetical protein
MKKYFLAGVCWCLIAVFPALAQPSVTDDAPPSKAEVVRFMDLMQVKVRLAQLFDGMKAQGRLGAEQGFKKKVPNATPEQLKKVDAIADELFSGFPIDDMIDAMIPIYQKHLTKSDLNAVIAFYSSPAGQKFIQEAPAMMSEAMQVGGEIGRSRMSDVNERLQKRIDELVKEGQPAGPSQAEPGHAGPGKEKAQPK